MAALVGTNPWYTYEVLTYDLFMEQAGFKSFKLYADFEDKGANKTSKRWFVAEVGQHDSYRYYCEI